MAKKRASKTTAAKRQVKRVKPQTDAIMASLGPIVDAIDRVQKDVRSSATGRTVKPQTLDFLSKLRDTVTRRCRATAKKPAPLRIPCCD